MNTKLTLFAMLLIAALVLAACGTAGAEREAPTTVPTAAMVEEDAAIVEGDAMAKDDDTRIARDDTTMAEGDAMEKDDVPTASENMMAMEDDGATSDGHEAMVEDDASMADGDAMATDDAAMALPAWLTAQLVDVNTGQAFTIADQKGKVVLVETLAVWCSNCLRQQKQVQALHEALGEREDLVSVGLGIDLNESAEQLRAHAQRNGFDWVYAVATPEVAREIGQLYGNLFLNPPSTPMLIVDRQGEVHPLPFGIKSAEDLQAALAPFLAEDM